MERTHKKELIKKILVGSIVADRDVQSQRYFKTAESAFSERF